MSEPISEASEWLNVLDNLLVRLSQLHKDEEEVTCRRLHREFGAAGCTGYAAWLIPGAVAAWGLQKDQCPPTNPTPDIETVALHAVIRALMRIPAYQPLERGEEGKEFPLDQRRELEELRQKTIRLAEDRLNQLRGAVPTKAVGQFTDLQEKTATLRLKGNEAIIIDTICKQNGEISLADLGAVLLWNAPFTEWNSARSRLNKKLAKHGWKLETHDRTVKAHQTLKKRIRK